MHIQRNPSSSPGMSLHPMEAPRVRVRVRVKARVPGLSFHPMEAPF